MGYRSEVASIIYGDADKVRALLAAARLQGNEALKELEDYIEIKTNEHRLEVELKLEDVKWYADFPFVQGWERLCSEAESMGLQWEFMRSGEDSSDIDHFHSDNHDQYHFYTDRRIHRF